MPVSIADHAARSRALDPTCSFIVQAPAGSGKTGLLTQRFLVLLAGVEAPEEVVAITFTRKAASEMRQRILQALTHAQASASAPVSQHEQHTWKLAQKALQRDKEQGWHLLSNPSRLRIQTIDSLSMSLTRQMPMLSNFGATPSIADDSQALYLEAASQAIAQMDAEDEHAEDIAYLVRHLDNKLNKLQGLIASMLATREQWLHYFIHLEHPALVRENLQKAMKNLIGEALHTLKEQACNMDALELLTLTCFAAKNVPDTSPIAACASLQHLPSEALSDLPVWKGLAHLLLTSEGNWRKIVKINEGFPAASRGKNKAEKERLKVMKVRMLEFLATLTDGAEAHEALRAALAALNTLPAPTYTDKEWKTLQALITVLRVAAGYLNIVFSEQAQADYPAVSQAALQALGDAESPTDLALALDYRIQHLLVDEFQDTSQGQYTLLNRLTAGWQPHDGHSLFVVGDPMQSIYRFREADVGLFLHAKDNDVGHSEHSGLSHVVLEPLCLSVNFRSQKGIVDWINAKFPEVFPLKNKATDGAVAYEPSTDIHPELEGHAVTIHPFLERDDEAEAREVVSIVQRHRAKNPQGSLAILVRNRPHLQYIIPHLQGAGLPFQALEIEKLTQRPVIQDLLALTRALTHLADRIAWLAVLRAPFCGFTLLDLYALTHPETAGDGAPKKSLIDSLRYAELASLSDDGKSRLTRILPILNTALQQQSRRSLRGHVEGVWIALGGPACVAHGTDLEDAEVFFQLLEKLSLTGDIPSAHELSEQINKLYALPDTQSDGALQIMTIHKSKGLEFDSVILPGLGRPPKNDDSQLLHWLERDNEQGERELLLAPINAQGDDKNIMAGYLQNLEKAKGNYEDGRLLYVAATRAKQYLHLLGNTTLRDNGEKGKRLNAPHKHSLLARLWPVVERDFQTCLEQQTNKAIVPKPLDETPHVVPSYQRLDSNWSLPIDRSVLTLNTTKNSLLSQAEIQLSKPSLDNAINTFDWLSEAARHTGTVVHRLLQCLAETGAINYDKPKLRAMAQTLLTQLGVPSHYLKQSIADAQAAVQATFEDERGQWVLSSEHDDAHCEWALSQRCNGRVEHAVIDRTFIDESGIRWIIDYKTSMYNGNEHNSLETFLDQEQNDYRPQLERYARLMRCLEKCPIRLGLYFPRLKAWREWAFV